MPEGAMKAWIESSHLSGANAAYIEELYESYLDNSQSVSAEWRDIFQQLPKIEGADVEYRHSEIRDEFKTLAQQTHKTVVVSGGGDAKQVKVLQLINAFRFRGHQNANLDPLGLWQRDKVRDLQLSHHDLSENDFDREFKVGSLAIGQETMKLGELYKTLKTTYCGAIGAEYMHITSTDEKRWLQQRLESVQSQAVLSVEEKEEIFKGLVAADGLEKYLGAKFPGAKRFSLEGGDALVPMLKQLITRAGTNGAKEVVLVGGYHAYKITDFLKNNNIPVLVQFTHNLPVFDDDDYDLPYKLPKLLVDAGLLVGIQNTNASNFQTRNLPFYAGQVGQQGLDKEKALQLITSNSAKILGIDADYGTLETGKSATLFISEGDALDMRGNQLTHAYIDGRTISLETHQTKLWKRYMDKYEGE